MANPEHLALLKKGGMAWEGQRPTRPDLSRADLSRLDLYGLSLHGADLSGAKLRGANLRNAHLDHASLVRADLCGADLSGADLSDSDFLGSLLIEANLREALLSRTDLSYASLVEADLREAHLSWTNLLGVELLDTNVAGAEVYATAFTALDLSRMRGLAEARHLGPSSVGVDTIGLTASSLTKNPARRAQVEAFLRGAGLSDYYLQAFRDSIDQAIEFYSCFISYSAEDEIFTRRLYDALQGRGIRCWLDKHQLLPGDDIYEQIDRGIRLWDKVLLCCSEASLTSWWVEREIEKALKKERDILKQQDRRVLALIPLALDESLFSWESGKASVILERHAVNFTGYQTDSAKFDEQFERVVKALRADEAKRERPPEPKL